MSHHLKVISYNIHKGFSLTQKFVLAEIREAIRTTGADVVFLQEVQGENQKHLKKISGWSDRQFEYLADSVWQHFAYGKNAIYGHGHHGNAILSKFPIQTWENLNLSNHRFEQRGLLHAEVNWNGSPLHLLCCHLDLSEFGRKRQISKIAERIRKTVPNDQRLILAGDFNDWRQRVTPYFSKELGLNEAFLTLKEQHAISFPAAKPFLRLDRMYYRGLHPLQAACRADLPWRNLSDHCAIETEFAII